MESIFPLIPILFAREEYPLSAEGRAASGVLIFARKIIKNHMRGRVSLLRILRRKHYGLERKHGYYDENQYLKKDKCEAIAEAKKYVENGVPNTYAVITEQTGFPDEMTEQDMESFDADETCYDTDAVIYSVMKDKDGNIRENFIE